ncbi:reductive dehalogenase [Thermodesulfobacteriota bacterium]
MLMVILLIIVAISIVTVGIFVIESIREKEPRAPKIGLAGIILLLVLALVILFVPLIRLPIAIVIGLCILFGLIMLIPIKPKKNIEKGAMRHVKGEVEIYDERDQCFARDGLGANEEAYKQYYSTHPEKEEKDAAIRVEGGFWTRMGAVDNLYKPNVAMEFAQAMIPNRLANYGKPNPKEEFWLPWLNPDKSPESDPDKIDEVKATRIIKGFANQLGACLVGVCKTNQKWKYSHRGEIMRENWEDYGKGIPEQLPYTVVIATEMDHEFIATTPHTPASVEVWRNYAMGSFITTALANWFAAMGYKAVAQHEETFEMLAVPLAIDAGLGELGRMGYVITEKYGPRVRLAYVTTDMPLVPDKPVDLGVEEFCEGCLKCAHSCPGRAVTMEEKTIVNGIERWKVDGYRCFKFWINNGGDCAICMGVCPFNRPNSTVHKRVRWMLRNSLIARKLFPPIDNFIYGKKWKVKKGPAWLDYGS